jgi:hypothetical protein
MQIWTMLSVYYQQMVFTILVLAVMLFLKLHGISYICVLISDVLMFSVNIME